jgi:hypothetical protein
LYFVCCGVFLCNFIHLCSMWVCKCVTFLLVCGLVWEKNHNILSYILLQQIISSAVVHVLVGLSIFSYQLSLNSESFKVMVLSFFNSFHKIRILFAPKEISQCCRWHTLLLPKSTHHPLSNLSIWFSQDVIWSDYGNTFCNSSNGKNLVKDNVADE